MSIWEWQRTAHAPAHPAWPGPCLNITCILQHREMKQFTRTHPASICQNPTSPVSQPCVVTTCNPRFAKMRAYNRHSNACAKQMVPYLRSHYGIVLFIHATYIFSRRGEDGHSVGTSPFGDTTCGVGSPIRLHIFRVNMSLITVIYWRQMQTPRKPYFLTIPTKRARKQQRRRLLCNSCFLQCSIRDYCISLVSSLHNSSDEGRQE